MCTTPACSLSLQLGTAADGWAVGRVAGNENAQKRRKAKKKKKKKEKKNRRVCARLFLSFFLSPISSSGLSFTFLSTPFAC